MRVLPFPRVSFQRLLELGSHQVVQGMFDIRTGSVLESDGVVDPDMNMYSAYLTECCHGPYCLRTWPLIQPGRERLFRFQTELMSAALKRDQISQILSMDEFERRITQEIWDICPVLPWFMEREVLKEGWSGSTCHISLL